ncbi:hypothetical protein LF1_35630 [Rubripirellula obstinata]|uniref:Sulfatase n=1 Tax=Rubripirellula obstinata TaxID=406547 RepID=A0A5B1CN67_9BACT|nr:hypothetical protein [Rubripirellula obstinata]KAA1261020.1 hypothetical protein LF1_35630 [Rubripirellula obstinata]
MTKPADDLPSELPGELPGDSQTDLFQDGRPLLVLSIEGLATSAIGCYGSSWNQTPAMDQIAASGCVFDRWINTQDRSPGLPVCLSNLHHWLEPWRQLGSTVLISDVSCPEDQSAAFDTVVQLNASGPLPSQPADEIDETRIAAQMAAVIEQDSLCDGDWSLMWLHTSVLTQVWDAPRSLFPIDEIELDLEPLEFPDQHQPSQSEPIDSAETIPAIMPTCEVPKLDLNDQRGGAGVHPDLVTSWMRTYGCQVRLLDLMIEILHQSLLREDVRIMIVGTSGFSLGQNGFIGHRAGPIRSHDCRLPIIISDTPPVRMPSPTPDTHLPAILKGLGNEQLDWCGPERWIGNASDSTDAIQTDSDRAKEVQTSAGWFFVRDCDESEHLFLKPDDVEDHNDVARLRPDIVESISDQDA